MTRRTSTGGTCKLCNQTGLIRLSHIVPKFLIRAAGLLGARFKIESLTFPATSEYNKQDGIKEYLLCDACERLFSLWEDYARRAFFTTSTTSRRMVGEHLIEWSGIDYPKMKMFTTSLLWRMSVSSHGFYSDVALGEKHDSIIQDMLLTSDPREPWRYGWTLMYLIRNDKSVGRIFSQPHRGRRHTNRKSYVGIIAGFYFDVDVANHAPDLENESNCLQADGKWFIPIVEASSSSLVRYEFSLHNIFL